MNPRFNYDAIDFTLAAGASLDWYGFEYLTVNLTTGTELAIAPLGQPSFGPFYNRQLLGDGEAEIGKIRIKNQSGAPVIGKLVTSTRRIVWADKQTVTVDGTVSTQLANVTAEGNNVDGDAVKTSGVMCTEAYNIGFNGTTWDRIRVGANNADAEAVATLGLLRTKSYGSLWNGTTWDRAPGDVTKGAYVQGAIASGSAHGTLKPVPIGGSDGTNARTIATDASGYVKVIVGTGNLNVALVNWAGQAAISGGVNGTVAVGGVAAHDAVVAGNPVLNGAEARTTDGTAVASGDLCRLMSNTQGKQVMLPWSLTENLVSGQTAAMTATTDTAMVAAAGAGIKNYLMGVICSNTHATVATAIAIKDGATEKFRTPVLAAVNGGFSQMFTVPIAGTANTAWNATNITTGSNTYAAAICWKGA